MCVSATQGLSQLTSHVSTTQMTVALHHIKRPMCQPQSLYKLDVLNNMQLILILFLKTSQKRDERRAQWKKSASKNKLRRRVLRSSANAIWNAWESSLTLRGRRRSRNNPQSRRKRQEEEMKFEFILSEVFILTISKHDRCNFSRLSF